MRDQTSSAATRSMRKEPEIQGSLNLITKKTLALELSISISMIDKLMVKGLPYKKLGRSVRFNLMCVAEFLNKEEHSMQKNDLETFRGKRILLAVPNAPGISRTLSWNEKNRRYETPKFGKIYCARKYAYQAEKKTRVFEYFTTLDEARKWQNSDIKPTQPTTITVATSGISKPSPTIASVIQKWKRDSWSMLARNTTIQYEKCLKPLESILGKEIESIKPSDIDELIYEWKKKFVQKSTRTSFAKELQTLKVLFRWYQNNYDDAALILPFKERHNEQIKVKQKKLVAKKHMSDEDADRFLCELRKDNYMFYALAFTQLKQMLRVSEVTAMKWHYLNAAEKTYDLCEHATWPREKNSVHEITPGTKNIAAGQIYTLNLFSDVVEVLSSVKRMQGCDLIFHDNGKLLSYRQVQYRFDKAFMAAGLPYRSTHILRHTGSTSFYNETGDLLALQQMGTWADARMPQHYAKVKSSRAKNAIRDLEQKQKVTRA